NDNPGLFTAQPAVSSNGTLTYTVAAGATGVANLTVTLKDDGGTDDNGDDTSPPQSFVITVGATGPVLSGLASSVTFLENTVNATPQQIDSDVTLTDSDSADFDGGNVTVAYTAAGTAQNQLNI